MLFRETDWFGEPTTFGNMPLWLAWVALSFGLALVALSLSSWLGGYEEGWALGILGLYPFFVGFQRLGVAHTSGRRLDAVRALGTAFVAVNAFFALASSDAAALFRAVFTFGVTVFLLLRAALFATGWYRSERPWNRVLSAFATVTVVGYLFLYFLADVIDYLL